jgi:hypothetical protein
MEGKEKKRENEWKKMESEERERDRERKGRKLLPSHQWYDVRSTVQVRYPVILLKGLCSKTGPHNQSDVACTTQLNSALR